MKRTPLQAGFTIPELVVVIVIVVMAIMVSFIFIHPRNYDKSNRNTQRLLDVARISQALTRYHADHGRLPDGITDTAALIGNAEPASLDLCPDLVPSYLKHMPTDPTMGAMMDSETCLRTEEKPSAYTTGYTILRQKDGTVVLEAPATEGSTSISLSRKY